MPVSNFDTCKRGQRNGCYSPGVGNLQSMANSGSVVKKGKEALLSLLALLITQPHPPIPPPLAYNLWTDLHFRDYCPQQGMEIPHPCSKDQLASPFSQKTHIPPIQTPINPFLWRGSFVHSSAGPEVSGILGCFLKHFPHNDCRSWRQHSHDFLSTQCLRTMS